MPRTEKQKAVTAYLSQQMYDQLSDFKFNEELRSDSQAIAVILERFFQQPSSRASADNDTEMRLGSLEDGFAALLDKVGELCGAVYGTGTAESNVPSTAESNVPSTARLIICKLYKNNADDPHHWRYWAGAKQGFVSDLEQAKSYKDEGAVKRQLNQIHQSDQAPTTRERISWKSHEELKSLISIK